MTDVVRGGRAIFSAGGNGEGIATVSAPSGHPDSYIVGGVDDSGRSWRPGTASPIPLLTASTPTRPYDTGESFSFPSTSDVALEGSQPFGGTSGAAPRTAGRAAVLVRHARELLGGGRRVGSDGALAVLGRGGRPPARGPLADGRLTNDELERVMRRTARPAEPPGPARYFVEGYGAFDERAQRVALAVLRGDASEPARAEEDARHAQVEQARRAAFAPERCSLPPG